jgi:AraC-like DNA-binding protein
VFIAHQLREGFSKFWLTPDVKMGVHYFHCFRDDFYCLPHIHPEYNVVICLDGEMEFSRKGKRENMKTGDVIVLNSGEMHQSRFGAEKSSGETVGLIIDKCQLREILLEMQFPPWSTKTQHIEFLGKAHDMKVVELTKELLWELQERRKGFGLLMQSLVVQILVYLFRNCLEPTIARTISRLPPQLLHWELTRAVEYMNTRGNCTFSLTELCSEIGCSSSRFVPLFKNSTGLTPYNFYNRILIERARDLLASGEYSIKEVAYTLGFRNLSHFYGVFHNLSGMTPRNYQAIEKTKTASTPECPR